MTLSYNNCEENGCNVLDNSLGINSYCDHDESTETLFIPGFKKETTTQYHIDTVCSAVSQLRRKNKKLLKKSTTGLASSLYKNLKYSKQRGWLDKQSSIGRKSPLSPPQKRSSRSISTFFMFIKSAGYQRKNFSMEYQNKSAIGDSLEMNSASELPNLQTSQHNPDPVIVNQRNLKMPRDELKKNKSAYFCSRFHILLAILCTITTILLSVLLTYIITKENIERRYSGDQNLDNSDHEATHLNEITMRYFVNTTYSDYDQENKNLESPSSSESDSTNGDSATNESIKVTLPQEPTAAELRLTENLFPVWYNLSLKIFVPGFIPLPEDKSLTFEGNLTLKFKVKQETNIIELNALKLTFPTNLSSIQILQDKNGTSVRGPTGIEVVNLNVSEALGKVFINLSQKLRQDEIYYIIIPYTGPIAKKLSGLYLTHYNTSDGEQRYAAVTQMEPTDARRLVPCFDEPSFKAIWSLQVTHPRGSKAVSNAIELLEDHETDHPDWIQTTFSETLPMSSYLLALVVSDFQYVEGYTNKNIRFRIWARSDALNYTSYALAAGIKVLEFYEDYYKIAFPLPKQDMMAFPDFAAGAMENWGLITYREKYLLYSPELYTLEQKMAVALVLSLELAHQWFGNLVTMKWWSDLWLNEGFATLMEYIGTDAISNGDFRMDEYFLIESLDSAFDRDSRATSHPLYFEIERAEDLSEAFDTITYSKGASILRMIRAIMGEEYFKKGLNIYLNRYKYSNADHDNLWNTLTEAVPTTLSEVNGKRFDVCMFAQSWTEQMGYPVVKVHRLDNNQIQLSQQRFKRDESALEKPKFQMPKFGYNWEVPIWYNINGLEKEMTWLTKKTVIKNITATDLLIVNSESRGFYRVQYGKKTLDIITEQLLKNHEQISVKSRSRVIDDTFTLAEAGRIPYAAALNLTRYLAQEKEYLPWEAALTGLSVIQIYFGDEPEAEHFRTYVKQIIGDHFEEIIKRIFEKKFFDDALFFENLLNIRVIQKMCSLRDLRCIEKILQVYQEYFIKPCQPDKENKGPLSSNCSKVPVALRSLAYCEGVHYGSEKDFEMIMNLYLKETVQVERERLMAALACSRDTYTLKKLLVLASDINSTVIRLQDKPAVFGSISNRIIGQKVVVDFFIDRWPQIYQGFKEQQSLLRTIISHSIVGSSQRLIDEVEKFISHNDKTTRNLDIFKQRLEIIKTNKKWMEKNFKPLSKWFLQQGQLMASKSLRLKKAYLGMQCFWGAESSFAKISGVRKTKVGYAGGTTLNPTYTNIGNHTEVVELEYDENMCSFSDIVTWFFANHDATINYKRQYESVILHTDEHQRFIAEKISDEEAKRTEKRLFTVIKPFDTFYCGEDYHQKYWLRCQRKIYNQLRIGASCKVEAVGLKLSDNEIADSVLATKINAYIAGYNDGFNELRALANEYKIPQEIVESVELIVKNGSGPRICH